MTAPNTYRIAAAFQAEKDPQQDAVIAWLGALPKDSRGGVKRSVMKYHLTRALLLYMQSGADTSTALHIGSGVVQPQTLMPAARTSFIPANIAPVQSMVSVHSATTPTPTPSTADMLHSSVPVLTDTIKKKSGGLRGKIAKSMQSSN